jgi:hypothetical protein
VRLISLSVLCLAALVTTALLIARPARAEVDFSRLHGSDLGLGLGARPISLGGAFAARADDASAAYWNPAGLSGVESGEVLLSGNIPHGMAAAIIAFGLSRASGWRVGLALSWVNRLDFEGDSGTGAWDGYSEHLLHLAMIDFEEDYSGRIESGTYDMRLSLAVSPPGRRRLAFGLNLARIR